MKVLVTGAGGFVGKIMCPYLAAAGHRVTGGYREAPPGPGWMDVLDLGNLERIEDFTATVAGFDAIVHLAARVHVMRETAGDADAAYGRANADVTERLARAAAEANVSRFVLLSSIKVNGEATAGLAFTGTDTPAPEDAYGRSKRAAEQALFEIANASNMTAVALRAPLIYGPGVGANFAALMRLCDTPTPLPFGGIVGNRRSLLYAGNLASAVRAILDCPAPVNGAYTLSDNDDLSTADLVRRLRRCLNRSPRLLPVPAGAIAMLAALAGKRAAADRLCGSLQADPAGFARVFDWTPAFSVDQGLAATVARYRAQR